MKKVFLSGALFLGLIGYCNAETTIKVGDKVTTYEQDLKLPTDGVYYINGATAKTYSWSIPIHWESNEGSGDFVIGGTDQNDWNTITDWLLPWFF